MVVHLLQVAALLLLQVAPVDVAVQRLRRLLRFLVDKLPVRAVAVELLLVLLPHLQWW